MIPLCVKGEIGFFWFQAFWTFRNALTFFIAYLLIFQWKITRKERVSRFNLSVFLLYSLWFSNKKAFAHKLASIPWMFASAFSIGFAINRAQSIVNLNLIKSSFSFIAPIPNAFSILVSKHQKFSHLHRLPHDDEIDSLSYVFRRPMTNSCANIYE